MAPTCRSLRNATRIQNMVEAAPTVTVPAARPAKGKKTVTKAPVDAVNAPEVVQREKAVRLAEIEDQLAKRTEKAKVAHPRRRAPKQVEPLIEGSGESALLPETGSYQSIVPVGFAGTLNSSQKEVASRGARSASSSNSEIQGDKMTEGPEYERMEAAKDIPVDTNVEINNLNTISHDTDSETEALKVAPPIKTPGKNLNKAMEKKKKGKAPNIWAEIQANRHIPPLGSKFQKQLVEADDTSNTTPATKKNLTNSVEIWAQGLPPPPPAKGLKVPKSHSATLVATSNEPLKVSRSIKSCTTVVEPTRGVSLPSRGLQEALPPPQGKKRLVESLASNSDAPSDISPLLPLSPKYHSKRKQTIELSSDNESDPPPRTTAARTSKKHRANSKYQPPPTQSTHATGGSRRKKAHADELSPSEQSSDDINHLSAPNQPSKRHRIAKKNLIEEPTSDSDGQSIPPPRYKPRTISRIKKRRVEDPASDVDEVDVPSTLYGGLKDEDDAAEKKATVGSPVHPRNAAKKSKTSLKVQPIITTNPRNSNLPHGALDNNRWSSYFIPTFLKYVGGIQQQMWALDETETMEALQAIWNRVYSGEKPVGGTKLVHVVGPEVYSLATQRVTEWRNSIGSAALAAVNDFFDSLKLYTTEERQEAAVDLLSCDRYIYNRTLDIEENGVKKILKNGRYRGPLVIHTVAQHLIDTENAIIVPGLIEDRDFPKAALALSAVAVHRALELWEKGYITYESYYEAKTKNLKTGGIVKVVGPDGKVKKTTNFGRKQCEYSSDQHINNVWLVDDGKMKVVVADIRKAADVILGRGGAPKSKQNTQDGAGPSQKARQMIRYESDPEFE